MTQIQTLLNDLFFWFSNIWTWMIEHPGLLIFLAMGALIPAGFWLWLYYRQVYMDKEDKKWMIVTFFCGIFAVLPVLGVNYLLKTFANFELINFVEDATLAQRIPLVILGFMIMGGLEEYAKFVIVRGVNDKQQAFNRVADGIEYAVAGALGFAFIENLAYFAVAAQEYSEGPINFVALMSDSTFIQIVIARNMGTMLVHTLFSGFLGYYYGKAKILGLQAEISEKKKLRKYLLVKGVKARVKRLRMIWDNRKFPVPRAIHIKQDELIAEGLMVAIVLHATYNSLLHLDVSYLIAPLIIGEFALIMHELHLEKNLLVYDLEKVERTEIRKELEKSVE
ncbi:MAG: hypothetical protein A2V81_03590 [Candidatus Abawacabacteria bacterium RBG_16_42_10]|uniref:PrsW family intramembrane metalloprotease n=1 Tax=Candidatus Abawacabacteria bacterium RBG_16_42_10 TaxID=1817814 RepID=A0A1F4XJQ0_9BACT|nr:MAG: hypothetical protein A2V81_03590 [Candidatus Abawacabacteria bacterium RBG_16_42_10]